MKLTLPLVALSALAASCLDKPPGLPEPLPPTPVETKPAETPPPTTSPSENPLDEGIARAGDEPAESSPRVADAESGPVDGPDPLGGQFGLAEATASLPGKGPLIATIKTSLGSIRCRLFEDRAPTTVANFVGLARGVRPFKSHTDHRWVKRPMYDGTSFHRVIRGFMIQGGDPRGDGTGEPGYVIPDEIWPGAKHDKAGLLCMANRGPDTNGGQFFITDASAPHLDRSYTIFGECSPVSTVKAIASVPKDDRDRPLKPVRISSVEIAHESP